MKRIILMLIVALALTGCGSSPVGRAAGGVAVIGFGMMAFFFAVGIAIIIIWIISLVDVIKSDFQKPNDKTMWIILLLLIPPIGAILYQLIGKKQKI